MSKTYKHLTDKEINMGWILYQNGVKNGVISSIIGRSRTTVDLIIKAKGNSNEYHKLMADYSNRAHRRLVPVTSKTLKDPSNLIDPTRPFDGWNTVIAILKAIEFNQQKQIELAKKYGEQMCEN